MGAVQWCYDRLLKSQPRACQLSRSATQRPTDTPHSSCVFSWKWFANVSHCTQAKMWTFWLRVSQYFCDNRVTNMTVPFLICATRWHNSTINTHHSSTHWKHPLSSEWINDEHKALASVFLTTNWNLGRMIVKTTVSAVMQFIWALWCDRRGVMDNVKHHDKLNTPLKGVSASQTAMVVWIRRWHCYTPVN